MKNKYLLPNLVDLGLTQNEAKVYLSALTLGPTTALKISRAMQIKRSTVYLAIESLQVKGLMAVDIKGLKKLYSAEDPEKLKVMINLKRENLQNLLPEYSRLYNLKGSESSIKYYSGLEAIKNIYDQLLKDIKVHDDYLVISNPDEWYNLDPEYFQAFRERRAKLNINVRLLMQDSQFGRQLHKLDRNYHEISKILPSRTKLTTSLMIVPAKVVIHQLTPPVGAVVIESPSTVQMHRELFNVIWDSIKE